MAGKLKAPPAPVSKSASQSGTMPSKFKAKKTKMAADQGYDSDASIASGSRPASMRLTSVERDSSVESGEANACLTLKLFSSALSPVKDEEEESAEDEPAKEEEEDEEKEESKKMKPDTEESEAEMVVRVTAPRWRGKSPSTSTRRPRAAASPPSRTSMWTHTTVSAITTAPAKRGRTSKTSKNAMKKGALLKHGRLQKRALAKKAAEEEDEEASSCRTARRLARRSLLHPRQRRSAL